MKIPYKKYLTKKNMLIAGGVLAAGVVVILLLRSRKKKEVDPASTGAVIGTGGVSYSNTWPLKRGSGRNEGEKALVRNLQRYLVLKGQNLNIDGIFGPKTESALFTFHSKRQVSEPLYSKMFLVLTGVKESI